MRFLSSIPSLCLILGILAFLRPSVGHAQADTLPADRYGDPFSDPGTKSPFDLRPSDYEYDAELAPDMRSFEIRERTGEIETRPPSTMTFEEFAEWKRRKMVEEYWRERASKETEDKREEEEVNDLVFAKKSPTGDTLVEIRPSGSVTLDFGGRWQRVDNPAIPVRQQRTGGFEFDQQISMNVLGVVGERLRITANWDTKAVFDFDNNVKIEYQGKEEDILQSIEAGNVSMPIRNSLVRGGQNLFGVKAELRFGRLYVTTLLSNQRGKTESIYLRGGAQQREFEIPVNEYDDTRHFLLSQYFHDVFELAYRNNPTAPNSQVRITRMEVYVTNRNNTTNNLRNVVGFLDLGENNAARINNDALVTPIGAEPVSHNGANTLFGNVTGLTGFRDVDQTVAALQGAGYASGTDFELIRSARKLDPARDYTFHPELGYLSLTTRLKNDEGVAVAFEFTYAGQQYKVGELSEDYQNLDPDQVVALKLLKPQSIRTDLPSFDLMMKNIYTLNTTSVQQDGFQLRVIYKDDLTGIDNPTLQEGIRIKDIPLVRVFGLDKLNPNGDFLPDGNFDWIAGATIIPDRGLVIFPQLEPFGNDLVVSSASTELGLISGTEAALIDKYTFTELYATTKSDALQAASKSKFFLTGVFQSASTADILLPGINIAPGSVVVTAGSINLSEGIDFTVDYNLGRVRILNQGALASGKEIRIQYERADLFNFRTKSLMGARFDYKVNRDLEIGATIMHMNERPLITRVNIGDEPIKNTQIGLDVNYESESRILTRAVDKLPGIQTKEESNVQINWEGAALIPGANKVLGDGGTSYLDDFEGAETPYDLTRNPSQWVIGSTPQRFPEAGSQNLDYAYRRAKLSWYNIDNSFYANGAGNNSISAPAADLLNHFTRPIGVNEVFPNRDQGAVIVNQNTLDIAYFPSERGPYNYQNGVGFLNPNGLFSNPTENWGAMTRAITFDTDFDNANIEFVEFWMMDPFMTSGGGNNIVRDGNPNTSDVPNTTGGSLYINLGNVSEDVLPDGVHAFENGLPDNTQATTWGEVTTEQFITPAFDNSRDRSSQDVGLDGLSSGAEQSFFSGFLGSIGFLNAGAQAELQADPSSDDYSHYRQSTGDDRPIIERYRDQANLENNSPTNAGGEFPQASKTTPDNEDLNQDNTINQTESYYEYRVQLQPGMDVGNHPYIVDKVTNTVNGDQVTWFQFRIPIREIDNVNAFQVGAISDFKTIKYIRTYLNGWSQPVVLRMAQLQVVGAQWRRFTDDLSEPGVVLPPESGGQGFTVGTVNIEENGGGSATSSPYTIPPDVVRDVDNTSQVTRQINEQSLRLSVTDLRDGDARAVFKNVAYDLLMYGKVRMFVHAERNGDLSTNDGEVQGFLRLGTDFTENYYEIGVPLQFSNVASADPEEVWRRANEINVPLEVLVDAKVERNRQNFSKLLRFETGYNQYTITVVGNPDLTSVRTMMIGIRNPRDDGQDKSATIWVNELRVADFNKDPGFATRGTVTAQLADLGSVVATGSVVTPNYGDIESRISERTRELTATYGFQTNLNLEKFAGEEIGLRLPLYASYDKEIVRPKYNPLDKDVELEKSLSAIDDPQERESLREKVVYEKTARSINLTGVQKTRVNPEAKPHIYDVENLTLSAGYSEERAGGIGGGDAAFGNNVQSRVQQQWTGTIAYAFNAKGLVIKPFAKSEGLKGKYLRPIKDFNINPLPVNYTLRANLDRRYTRTQLYNSQFTTEGVTPQYEKSFYFNRTYGLRWNLTESIKVNFNADARAIIDEPEGDRQDYRDTIWTQLFSGGRLKQYTQSIDVTYRLPFAKLPLTQWIDADVNYTAGYNWTAAALGLEDTIGNPLGNTIDNSRQIKLQTRLNLQRLYTAIPFIRKVQTPAPAPKPGPKAPTDTSTTKRAGPSGLAKFTVNLLTVVKTVNGSYSVSQSTLLPGFLPTPNYFGLDNATGGPGLAFTLGSQNGSQIQQDAVDGDWLTRSTQLNSPFTQARTRDLNLRANLEPIRDLRVQVDAKQQLTNTYQETFRFDDVSGEFQSFSPTQGGSLQRSIISINTAFEPSGPNNTSEAFSNLEAYRDVVQARLDAENQNNGTYGRNSQSVLIPAFIAAYTGKSPTEVNLDPYPKTPLPNWRIDYAGLSRVKALQKLFTSINLTHSYSSTYDVNSYTSSLAYDGSLVTPNVDLLNSPQPTDTNSAGEFIPVFIVEQVSIMERFAPLLGVNVRLRNKMTLKLEYQRDRTVTLNVSNAQVTELRNQGIVVGVGWTKAGVKLPFGRPGRQIVLENDLSFKTDVTIRETVTYQRTLDGPAVVTAGNLNFQLRPTLSYVLNRRVNLQMYFERTINAPRISSAFRRTTTAFGVQLRFSLN